MKKLQRNQLKLKKKEKCTRKSKLTIKLIQILRLVVVCK